VLVTHEHFDHNGVALDDCDPVVVEVLVGDQHEIRHDALDRRILELEPARRRLRTCRRKGR
jgi:hypothetical protein